MASYCLFISQNGEISYHVSTYTFLSRYLYISMFIKLTANSVVILLFTARPSFYNYIAVMFFVSALAFFASALAAFGVEFGIW